jgi:hypothetical protein
MKKLLVIPMLLVALACAAQLDPIAYIVAPDMNMSLKNVSGKPIVALMVQIDGIETRTLYKHDFFTKSVQFDPDTTLDDVVDPAQDPDVKEWKVTVVWCQFTDGSQWGDKTRGEVILSTRAAAVEMFTALAAAASDAEFGSVLDNAAASTNRDRGPLTGTARLLKETLTTQGIKAVRAIIAERLANIAARQKGFEVIKTERVVTNRP